ncbi:IS1595 family transposase, partial [Erysipelotrichaceae bacterium 7770_A6]|nr:IS1595 family transposase [Erysipelotrichaceae bacterium 7770_A6]
MTAATFQHRFSTVCISTFCTVVSGEIELDEKYVLNSHKGEKIDNLKPRKRGGSASKRGLSNEQICLPTAVQRNGTAVLKATNTAAP